MKDTSNTSQRQLFSYFDLYREIEWYGGIVLDFYYLIGESGMEECFMGKFRMESLLFKDIEQHDIYTCA